MWEATGTRAIKVVLTESLPSIALYADLKKTDSQRFEVAVPESRWTAWEAVSFHFFIADKAVPRVRDYTPTRAVRVKPKQEAI